MVGVFLQLKIIIMKITLQSKPNSFLINDREFQKGYIDVNYRVDGTIGFGNTIKGTLDEITIDGKPVSNVDELKEWVSANMFMGGGSGSGGGNGSTDGLTWADTSMMPVANKVVRFSEQGLVSTGMPEFPENAVPLMLLDLRIPAPPTNGSFLLMSFDGKVEWIPN